MSADDAIYFQNSEHIIQMLKLFWVLLSSQIYLILCNLCLMENGLND